MTLSEKIANCPKCMEYAKGFCNSHYKDLFQDTWLDIKIYEEKFPEKLKSIKCYKSYFWTSLSRRFRKSFMVKHIDRYGYLDSTEEADLITSERLSNFHQESNNIPPVAYLNEWLNEKPRDELHLFYKNIITLVLVCKDNNDVIRMIGMSKSKFYPHYKEAKQQLRHDYITTTNCNNVDRDSMV